MAQGVVVTKHGKGASSFSYRSVNQLPFPPAFRLARARPWGRQGDGRGGATTKVCSAVSIFVSSLEVALCSSFFLSLC